MIYRILFFILHTRKKTSLTIKVYTSYYIYIYLHLSSRTEINYYFYIVQFCTINQKPCVCVTNTNDTHTPMIFNISYIFIKIFVILYL